MNKGWIGNLTTAQLAVSVVSALVLTACGGGAGGAGTAVAPALDGVVAVGAPVPGAEVTVKDSNGNTTATTADDQGYYSFAADKLSPLKAPLLIQAMGTVGGSAVTLHSLMDTVPTASNAKVINVTPATDAITAQTLEADPATVFKDKAPASVDQAKLDAAKSRLQNALKDVLTALGKDPATIDLMSTKFTADNTGLDKLFDLVSIQTNAQSPTERTVVVAEKKDGGKSVTLSTSTTPSSVTSLAAPTQAEVKLDTAIIKNFISIFNKLVQTKEGVNSAEMLDMFHTDFLDDGMSRQDLIKHLADNAVGRIQLSNLLLSGCTTPIGATTDLTGSICKGQMTVTSSDTNEVETMPMSFKLGESAKWQAYGNRSPFNFELKPVISQNSMYSSPSATPTVTTNWGINFYFPIIKSNVGGVDTVKYQSVNLLSSNDNGDNWSLVATLRTPTPDSKCSASIDWMPIGGGANSCTNFIPIMGAASIAASNDALAAGTKLFKIQAYASTDTSGTPTEFTAHSKRPLFNESTAKQALNDLSASITSSELNTPSVKFTIGGSGVLESVNIGVRANASLSSVSDTNWGTPSKIKALNGVASVAQAKVLCLGNNPDATLQANCNASYGSEATIRRIHLSVRDSQGRGIWRGYNLQ